MSMSHNLLMNGDPTAVADALGWSCDVEVSDLTPALINALNRISALERQVERLREQLEGPPTEPEPDPDDADE